MSWTKMIICDLCEKQHSFFGDVLMERAFISTHLLWVHFKSGRTWYDICPECRGDLSIQELITFFRNNPVTRETLKETIYKCFEKGWNSKDDKR